MGSWANALTMACVHGRGNGGAECVLVAEDRTEQNRREWDRA